MIKRLLVCKLTVEEEDVIAATILLREDDIEVYELVLDNLNTCDNVSCLYRARDKATAIGNDNFVRTLVRRSTTLPPMEIRGREVCREGDRGGEGEERRAGTKVGMTRSKTLLMMANKLFFKKLYS